MLHGEIAEDSVFLISLGSIRLNVAWEGATRSRVGTSSLDLRPVCLSNTNILIIDLFMRKEIADCLTTSLDIEVNKLGLCVLGHNMI